MNRLKQLRLEACESQEYVGMLIGVSGQAVGQYESEKRDLSPDKILKLAEHYNCTTDYLLGKSNIRNPEELTLDPDKIKIGLSTRDYGIPTKEQQDKIEEFAKFVLQENLKKKNNNNS